MTDTYQSCLINRLSRFMSLSDTECAFVEKMEEVEEPLAKGRPVVALGSMSDRIVVLKSGWAVVKADCGDGSSQILRVYLPGEIIGLAELGSIHANHRIVMQTDGTVCPFPRKGLVQLLTDHPRLAALLIAVGSLDQIALRHQASSLGSMDAMKKLKFFLLQLRARLEVANVGLGNRFQVPFSQVEIGEAVGLTSIYVNKLLRRLTDAGELEIERPYFRLLARDEWETDIEFVDAFVDMDISWFPSASTPASNLAPSLAVSLKREADDLP